MVGLAWSTTFGTWEPKLRWHGNAGYGQRGTGWVGAGNRTWWNGDKREGEET